MKPVGDNQASASLLVIGHGLSLVFLCLALHFAASGFRIFGELLGDGWLEILPEVGLLILSADTFLQTRWLVLLPAFALALWLDWAVVLQLLRRFPAIPARLWAYCIFGPVILLTAMCVGSFRYWMWWMLKPIGGPS